MNLFNAADVPHRTLGLVDGSGWSCLKSTGLLLTRSTRPEVWFWLCVHNLHRSELVWPFEVSVVGASGCLVVVLVWLGCWELYLLWSTAKTQMLIHRERIQCGKDMDKTLYCCSTPASVGLPAIYTCIQFSVVCLKLYQSRITRIITTAPGKNPWCSGKSEFFTAPLDWHVREPVLWLGFDTGT